MSQAESSFLRPPVASHPRWQTVWSYAQHEILYLMWILMEVALLTPLLVSWVTAVSDWPPGLFLLWLLLLIYLPFNLVRLMSTLDWPRSRQRHILAVAVPLIYLFSLRALFYQPISPFDFSWLAQFFSTLAEPENIDWQRNLAWFGLIIFLWWRGLRLIDKSFSIHNTGRRLRVGGLLLMPGLILISRNRLPWSIAPFILLFFFASLTAVALTRMDEVEQQQSGRSVSLNPKWLFSVGLAALMLIIATAFITFLISGETMLTILGWLHPLWRASYAGGMVIISTIFYLLQPFLTLLSLLLDLIIKLLQPLMSQFSETAASLLNNSPLATPTAAATPGAPTDLGGSLKAINILLMLAIVLTVTLALGRLYRKAEFAAQENEAATKASNTKTTPKPGLGQKLRDRLNSLRGWRTAASVRRIYQNMCRAAAVNGYPRAKAETPFEYLTTLAKAWPENQNDTRLVTEAYVMVRYGELPESATALEEIHQAWKRLEAMPPTNTLKGAKPPRLSP